MGKDHEHFEELRTFSVTLAIAVAGGLGLVAFTPLVNVWFQDISGLSAELTEFAITPTRIIVIFPALTVLISLQRAVLVTGRRTGPITWATAVEVLIIALVFPIFGWGLGLVGVTAAFAAVVFGRLGSTTFLTVPTLRMLNRSSAARPSPRDP
jgi:O-antigen/teichoic acid export membrane protein